MAQDPADSGRGPDPSELSALLVSTDSFTDLLQGVAELAVRQVEAAATSGITLSQGDRLLTVASADDLAVQLDEQQYELDDGPCLSALHTGTPVHVPDLADESRWDGYPTILLANGMVSMLALPLLVGGRPVGVLNLYGRARGGFAGRDLQLAELVAGQAAMALTAAMRHYDESTLSDHLRAALSSRSTIDQAIGIVMAQQRCGADEAFGILRGVSQRRNVKLRVVAEQLVASVGGHSPG